MRFQISIKSLFASFLFVFYLVASSAAIKIEHIEPAHWWLGMKSNQFQVLLHGTDLAKATVTVKEPGLILKKTNRTSNPNYLFLDMEIAGSAKAGIYHLVLQKNGETTTIDYLLKSRSEMAKGGKGYGPEDVLYLIMPDRFANGNPSNDAVAGYPDLPNRNEPFGRHGGDLAGIENHLDFMEDLGVTTLWINPVLDNNQPKSSYHGYSITDFYKVDPRFGNLDDYKRLTQKCHAKGMKMVQDMVANHIGNGHWWMKDLPDSDWLHPMGDPVNYNRSNFRIETVCDPNGAPSDKLKMLDGWFDSHMPDLNQKNPYLANYLIQNSLWWIAEVGIDGIRMDTYPYNDPDFMTRYCEEIQKEFPEFSIVGEVWVDNAGLASYFVKGAKNQDGYKAGLPTITDFPTFFAITKGLQEKGGWDSGLQRIYGALSQDFLYQDPSRQLIFLDNHDLTRFYTSQKEDFDKFKQGLGMLLTLRGVPQLYYGNEILMTGDASSHPEVRKDYPGGWPGDPVNLFKPENRKGKIDSAFNFTRKLLNWRKKSVAIAKGKMIQYLPESNIYVYFRKHGDQLVMVIVNGNDVNKELKTSRFVETIGTKRMAMDVLSGESVDLSGGKLNLSPNGITILDFK